MNKSVCVQEKIQLRKHILNLFTKSFVFHLDGLSCIRGIIKIFSEAFLFKYKKAMYNF